MRNAFSQLDTGIGHAADWSTFAREHPGLGGSQIVGLALDHFNNVTQTSEICDFPDEQVCNIISNNYNIEVGSSI